MNASLQRPDIATEQTRRINATGRYIGEERIFQMVQLERRIHDSAPDYYEAACLLEVLFESVISRMEECSTWVEQLELKDAADALAELLRGLEAK